MRKWIGGAAVLAVIGGGAWYTTQVAKPDAFAEACDNEIKEDLRSPSTYRVTQVRELSQKASDEEIEKFCGIYAKDPDIFEWCMTTTKRDGAWSHMRLVNYEAANAYGTPVAGMSSCRLVSRLVRADLNEESGIGLSMTLDGKTSHERDMALIDALNAADRADRELLQRLEGGQ